MILERVAIKAISLLLIPQRLIGRHIICFFYKLELDEYISVSRLVESYVVFSTIAFFVMTWPISKFFGSGIIKP